MMQKFTQIIVVAFCMFLPAVGFALSLDEAKERGVVGEQADGYLGVRESVGDAAQLVAEINHKRKIKYREIAASNGTTIAAVEQIAAKKAIENTKQGHYIRDAHGVWRRK